VISIRTPSRFVALVALLGLAQGCHRASPPEVGVEPLQLFGAEPELMPALQFEPEEGTLVVSARQPVYLTVVRVDPTSQVRTVVFPESGRAPLRVSGQVSLQLASLRLGEASLASGQAGAADNRGGCTTTGAAWGAANACAGSARAAERREATDGILVIASQGSLVVPTNETAGSPAGWGIPDEMPELWAAVYVWPPARGARASGGGGR